MPSENQVSSEPLADSDPSYGSAIQATLQLRDLCQGLLASGTLDDIQSELIDEFRNVLSQWISNLQTAANP